MILVVNCLQRMRIGIYRRSLRSSVTKEKYKRGLLRMDVKRKRERKANFSDEEVRCLLEGIGEDKEILNCQLQSTVTARRKKETWDRVTMKVNSVSRGAARSVDDVKQKWKQLKSAVLRAQADQKKTGGGVPVKDTPFKELVLYIIGDGSDSVSGIEGNA